MKFDPFALMGNNSILLWSIAKQTVADIVRWLSLPEINKYGMDKWLHLHKSSDVITYSYSVL